MTTIVVIDDEPVIAGLIKDILRGEGYHVATALSGHAGVDLVRRLQPDLIICDERMAGMTGGEVCEHLYGLPVTALIPIILMSAHPQSVRAITPNCLVLLRKPFALDTLLETIEDSLGRAFVVDR